MVKIFSCHENPNPKMGERFPLGDCPPTYSGSMPNTFPIILNPSLISHPLLQSLGPHLSHFLISLTNLPKFVLAILAVPPSLLQLVYAPTSPPYKFSHDYTAVTPYQTSHHTSCTQTFLSLAQCILFSCMNNQILCCSCTPYHTLIPASQFIIHSPLILFQIFLPHYQLICILYPFAYPRDRVPNNIFQYNTVLFFSSLIFCPFQFLPPPEHNSFRPSIIDYPDQVTNHPKTVFFIFHSTDFPPYSNLAYALFTYLPNICRNRSNKEILHYMVDERIIQPPSFCPASFHFTMTHNPQQQ